MIKVTLNIELSDEQIEQIIKSNHLFDLTKDEVEQQVTTFLKEEVGTTKGLLMLINMIDLFNY